MMPRGYPRMELLGFALQLTFCFYFFLKSYLQNNKEKYEK
jgi:hypothetical protein